MLVLGCLYLSLNYYMSYQFFLFLLIISALAVTCII
jgi:hypothetical protein